MNVTTEQITQWLSDVCTLLNMELPRLTMINNTKGGARRIRTVDGVHFEIDLPVGILQHGPAFSKYYIVHECTHLNANNSKHDSNFKTAEAANLNRAFGIGIKYSRAFPKYLYDVHDTKTILWGRSDSKLGMGPCLRKVLK